MTGATSTLAGGGPVDARTLLLLRPSELDNNAAPMNPAKIFLFIVLSSQSSYRRARATTLAKLCANAARRVMSPACYSVTDYVSFVTIQKYAEKIFGPRCSTAASHPRCCP